MDVNHEGGQRGSPLEFGVGDANENCRQILKNIDQNSPKHAIQAKKSIFLGRA